jgi:hypothetical protein
MRIDFLADHFNEIIVTSCRSTFIQQFHVCSIFKSLIQFSGGNATPEKFSAFRHP